MTPADWAYLIVSIILAIALVYVIAADARAGRIRHQTADPACVRARQPRRIDPPWWRPFARLAWNRYVRNIGYSCVHCHETRRRIQRLVESLK